MADAVLAFVAGVVSGLLVRPLLDAYLLWRTIEHLRRPDEPPPLSPDGSRNGSNAW